MKFAIALITHSRDRYFELVFESLINQLIKSKPVHDTYDIYVFQDGLANEAPLSVALGHERIASFMRGKVSLAAYVLQGENLGIALHFDLIERFLFVEKGYDYAVFCEDDLVLAPGYIATLDALRVAFQLDARIGMVSANPDNPFLPLIEQREGKHRYLPMGHNWGFGLSRAFWLRRQGFVDIYLDFVRGKPYQGRPHESIKSWLESCGFQGKASSQDYVKQCATSALGAVRISTLPNFGLYVGRQGVHCTPDLFQSMGFGNSQVYNEEIEVAGELGSAQFAQIYRKQLGDVCPNPDAFNPESWSRMLALGDFRAMAKELIYPQTPTLTVAEIRAICRLFLELEPEQSETATTLARQTSVQALEHLLSSREFLDRPGRRELLLRVASNIAS
jgi:hypothetical protein